MKKTLAILVLFVFCFTLTACNSDKAFYEEYPTGEDVETIAIEKNPVATITLEDGSKIVVELKYDAAPNAVQDFIALAKEGVYSNLSFNLVRNKCILMTGNADHSDFKPPYYVKDETENNNLSHVRGTVSMIRTSSKNTLTGQFFILTDDQTHFDSRFTAFGTVTEGMEVLDAIAAAERDADGKLTAPFAIKSVKVDTFGKKFPNPTIIPIGE